MAGMPNSFAGKVRTLSFPGLLFVRMVDRKINGKSAGITVRIQRLMPCSAPRNAVLLSRINMAMAIAAAVQMTLCLVFIEIHPGKNLCNPAAVHAYAFA